MKIFLVLGTFLLTLSFNSNAHLNWFEAVSEKKDNKYSFTIHSYVSMSPFHKNRESLINELHLYGSSKSLKYSKNDLISNVDFGVKKVIATYNMKSRRAKIDRLTGESLPKRYELERVSAYLNIDRKFIDKVDSKHFLGILGKPPITKLNQEFELSVFSNGKPKGGVEILVYIPSQGFNRAFLKIKTNKKGIAKFKPKTKGKYFFRARFIETRASDLLYSYEALILEIKD